MKPKSSRIVALSINSDKCRMLVESTELRLGISDTITLSAEQLRDFKALKIKLDEQETLYQEEDLQLKIIHKFRALQSLQKSDGYVYSECQNSVDCG